MAFRNYGESKRTRLLVTLSPPELAAVKIAAAQRSLPVAVFIRMSAIDAAGVVIDKATKKEAKSGKHVPWPCADCGWIAANDDDLKRHIVEEHLE